MGLGGVAECGGGSRLGWWSAGSGGECENGSVGRVARGGEETPIYFSLGSIIKVAIFSSFLSNPSYIS